MDRIDSKGKKRCSMTKLDTKVHGTLVRNKNGQEIPPDEFVVFRPGDNSLLPTLNFYYRECEAQGADDAQLKAVDDLIMRVKIWRDDHPNRCKIADVEPGELRST